MTLAEYRKLKNEKLREGNFKVRMLRSATNRARRTILVGSVVTVLRKRGGLHVRSEDGVEICNIPPSAVELVLGDAR